MSEHKQVAGGGGVDALRNIIKRKRLEAKEHDEHADNLTMYEAERRDDCRRAADRLRADADELEAALSTQPLLSDQPAGVSNELRLAGTMLANCAFNLAQRPHLTDDERRSLDESRRAWDAALHPEQAKDGAAG